MRYQYLRFPGGLPKAVTFSYDDGCPQDIRFAQTLTKYGLKCTFNLNSDELRGAKALTREQIVETFLNCGHEIAVHGYLHRAEGCVRPIEGIRDVLDCRIELENKYGMIIRGMAYPDCGITRFHNGTDYQKIKNYLTDLGIVYSRTLGGDNDRFELPTDWHAWMPSMHHNNPHAMEYIDKFLAIKHTPTSYHAGRQPRLLYIWGHSYEFDRNNNWELLDALGQKLEGHDDVWYATNIEIYDYVTAYNSLVYSADGSMIYNPTLRTVWFDRDGVGYCIKSGETIKI